MRKVFSAAAMLLALAVGARAQFINATVKMPVDRAVANAEAYLKDKPDDARGWYVLGRLHAMAYAYGKELTLWQPGGRLPRRGGVEVGDANGKMLPGFAPYDSVEVRRGDQAPAAEDLAHLGESIRAYQKAVEKDAKLPIAQLGLAWVLQEAGKHAAEMPAGDAEQKISADEKASYEAAITQLGDPDPHVREKATATLKAALPKCIEALKAAKKDDPEVKQRVGGILKSYWDMQALEHYRAAYALEKDRDLKARGSGPAADSQISAEAGEAILEILNDNRSAEKTDESTDINETLAKLREKGGAITPIIFSLEGAEKVDELLDPAKHVGFDLAGDGVARQYPWVKGTTAILVWDPGATGRITSGRQLFGSSTWWIAFDNGYRALDLLDDNRDGRLSGDELHGIRVWIDADGNGVADAGETHDLADVGVTAIDTHATLDGDTPKSLIHLASGKVVNSFDWTTEPVRNRSAH